jgi:hypothetical protein
VARWNNPAGLFFFQEARFDPVRPKYRITARCLHGVQWATVKTERIDDAAGFAFAEALTYTASGNA